MAGGCSHFSKHSYPTPATTAAIKCRLDCPRSTGFPVPGWLAADAAQRDLTGPVVGNIALPRLQHRAVDFAKASPLVLHTRLGCRNESKRRRVEPNRESAASCRILRRQQAPQSRPRAYEGDSLLTRGGCSGFTHFRIPRSIHELHVRQALSRRRRTFVGGQFSMSPDAQLSLETRHTNSWSHAPIRAATGKHTTGKPYYFFVLWIASILEITASKFLCIVGSPAIVSLRREETAWRPAGV